MANALSPLSGQGKHLPVPYVIEGGFPNKRNDCQCPTQAAEIAMAVNG
jgi:hypothetical protein